MHNGGLVAVVSIGILLLFAILAVLYLSSEARLLRTGEPLPPPPGIPPFCPEHDSGSECPNRYVGGKYCPGEKTYTITLTGTGQGTDARRQAFNMVQRDADVRCSSGDLYLSCKGRLQECAQAIYITPPVTESPSGEPMPTMIPEEPTLPGARCVAKAEPECRAGRAIDGVSVWAQCTVLGDPVEVHARGTSQYTYNYTVRCEFSCECCQRCKDANRCSRFDQCSEAGPVCDPEHDPDGECKCIGSGERGCKSCEDRYRVGASCTSNLPCCGNLECVNFKCARSSPGATSPAPVEEGGEEAGTGFSEFFDFVF